MKYFNQVIAFILSVSLLPSPLPEREQFLSPFSGFSPQVTSFLPQQQVSSADRVDLKSAVSLVQMLSQRNWSSEEMVELFKKRVAFKNELVDLYQQTSFSDPSRMFVSPRDQKRWIKETIAWLQAGASVGKAIFMGALANYLENIDPEQKSDDGTLLIEKALEIFAAHFSIYFQKGEEKQIKEWLYELDYPGLEPRSGADLIPKQKRIRSQVRHVFFNKLPALFLKEGEEGKDLEKILKEETALLGGKFVRMPMGPYSDKAQILGRQAPAADGGLTFSKGTLVRAYETAIHHPEQPIVLLIDNIDATAAKVRNGIYNHLLEKGEMHVVGYGRITLPKNLHLIFTASTQIPMKDQALLNRLQKYALPRMTIEDRLELALSSKHQNIYLKSLKEIFTKFKDEFADPDILPFHPNTITQLFERLNGMAKETNTPWDHNLLARELHIILLDQIPDPEKRNAFKNYLINEGFPFPKDLEEEPYSFDASGELFVLGVAAGLSEPLKKKIAAVSEKDRAKKKWEQEIILYRWQNEPNGRKAGVVLQSQSIPMLASLIRQIRYNNRVLKVVGPTGVGKTFVGEALAILRGQPSYSEPTHKRSEQEQWTGFYEVNAAGKFIYNDQTPFLKMIRTGGADLKSELNAKGDFNRTAYMSWYLNQIAKEEKELVLPFVREGEEGETSSEKIDSKYWMLVDINPEGVYGHRYPINPEFDALSGQIYLNGRYTDADYRKMLTMALEDSSLKADEKNLAIDVLTQVHQTLANALLDGEFNESATMVLTLRELLNRSVNQLLGLCDSSTPVGARHAVPLQQVVEDNYLAFWNDEEDYLAARNKVNKILKSNHLSEIETDRHSQRTVYQQIKKWLLEALKNPHLSSIPPVHLRFAVESLGARMGKTLAEDNNWKFEKALVSGFTDEYDLKGAFVPRPKNEKGEAQLEWVGGLLVRKIQEAQDNPKQIHLLELEGFHRLDPEVAIMLNEFFLSGTLYLPGREPLKIPKNLIFFLTSPLEVELEISPAEQSRHLRVTLYDYSEAEKKIMIGEKLRSIFDKGSLNLPLQKIEQLTDHILKKWKAVNAQLEADDREEYRRGISFWTSYVATLAHLIEQNKGDIPAAVKKGEAIFLSAVLGKSVSEEEARAPLNFLTAFPLTDLMLDYAISHSDPSGKIDFDSLQKFCDEKKSEKKRLQHLLLQEKEMLKIYPHKKLEQQTLRPGDFVQTPAGEYQLFLGWDKKETPILLTAELALQTAFPNAATVLSRILLEEHAAGLKASSSTSAFKNGIKSASAKERFIFRDLPESLPEGKLKPKETPDSFFLPGKWLDRFFKEGDLIKLKGNIFRVSKVDGAKVSIRDKEGETKVLTLEEMEQVRVLEPKYIPIFGLYLFLQADFKEALANQKTSIEEWKNLLRQLEVFINNHPEDALPFFDWQAPLWRQFLEQVLLPLLPESVDLKNPSVESMGIYFNLARSNLMKKLKELGRKELMPIISNDFIKAYEQKETQKEVQQFLSKGEKVINDLLRDKDVSDKIKAEALIELAEGFLKIGKSATKPLREAKDYADLITNFDEKQRVLQKLSRAYALVGDYEKSEKMIVPGIKAEDILFQALIELAKSLCLGKTGDKTKGLEILVLISTKIGYMRLEDQLILLKDLSEAYAAIGEYEESEEIAKKILEKTGIPTVAGWAYIELSRHLFLAGKKEEAQEQLVHGEKLIFSTKFKLKVAIQNFFPTKYQEYRSGALTAYSELLALMEEYGKSKSAARDIQDKDTRYRRLVALAKTLFMSGEREEAMRILNERENSPNKANAMLLELAQGFAFVGEHQKAKELFAQVELSIINSRDSDAKKSFDWFSLFEAYLAAKYYDQAKRVASQYLFHFHKAKAFIALAVAFSSPAQGENSFSETIELLDDLVEINTIQEVVHPANPNRILLHVEALSHMQDINGFRFINTYIYIVDLEPGLNFRRVKSTKLEDISKVIVLASGGFIVESSGGSGKNFSLYDADGKLLGGWSGSAEDEIIPLMTGGFLWKTKENGKWFVLHYSDSKFFKNKVECGKDKPELMVYQNGYGVWLGKFGSQDVSFVSATGFDNEGKTVPLDSLKGKIETPESPIEITIAPEKTSFTVTYPRAAKVAPLPKEEEKEPNLNEKVWQTPFSELELSPVLLPKEGAAEPAAEEKKSAPVAQNTDSSERIQIQETKTGFVLNVDGFEMPVYNKKLADSLQEHYLIPTDRHIRALGRHMDAMRQGKMVFNIGAPGTGKTAVGIDLANRLGLPYHVKPQHGMVDEKELFGEWVQDEKGDYILTSDYDYVDWKTKKKVVNANREELDKLDWYELKARGIKRQFKSIFLDFFFNGGIYIFDEGGVGQRGKKLLELLTSVARGDKKIYLNKSPAQKGTLLKQNKFFHAIITSNEGREPLAADLMAELDVYFMNSDFTDSELEKILYSIYRTAPPSLTEQERYSLMARQIRVHRSILALLEHGKEGERLKEIYQFGLRELTFAAKDIVNYLDRYPDDKELAFVDKIYSAYYKLLQTSQERSAVLKIIERHFRPVDEVGNQLFHRIDLVGHNLRDPLYRGKILTELAVAKYLRGRTQEQFQAVIQDLFAIPDAAMRAHAFLKLLRQVKQSGFERDLIVLTRLTLSPIAQVTDAAEKENLLQILEELVGENKVELDASYYQEEIHALAQAIPKSQETAFQSLLEQLRQALARFIETGGEKQNLNKDLFDLVKQFKQNKPDFRLVFDLTRFLLLFAQQQIWTELFSSVFSSFFGFSFGGKLEEWKLPDELSLDQTRKQGLLLKPLPFEAGPTTILVNGIDSMKENLLKRKDEVLKQPDAKKFLEELDRFFALFEVYLTYLRFLGRDLKEELKPIVDLSLASDFSQIAQFNEKFSEKERLFWLTASLKAMEFLPKEAGSGSTESVERYADALYLDFGLGAPRRLTVTKDEKHVYISDVKLLRGNEVSLARAATVPFIRSEESAIRGIAQGFAGKVATVSLLERGARIDELLTFLAEEMGYRVISMAGTRFKTVESLFGGLDIFETIDLKTGKEMAWKPGLITRYMVEDPKALAEESVILDIRNLHQIPRDVRSTLFQLLQDRYWDVTTEKGEKKRLYLPQNVKLHFTLPAGVEADLESAFFSRVEKVFVSGLRYDPDIEWGLIEASSSATELEKVIEKVYGLTLGEAKKIRTVLAGLHIWDGKSKWEEDFHYDFHAGDGLEMAAWVKQALDYEQAKNGVELNATQRLNVAMLEIYRYVMMKMREEDYKEAEKLFATIFKFTPPSLPPLRVGETGLVLEVMGVGVQPNRAKAKKPSQVDPNYQLTLVPSLAWRMSGILRAISPRKDRFERLQAGRSVLTIGNSSMGKTTVGGFLTQILGLDNYFVFSVDGQTEENDLTWEHVANLERGKPTSDGLRVQGRFAKKIQPFLEKFTQDNQVLMIDEINLKPEILFFFALVAQGVETIYLDMPGEKTQIYRRGKNVTLLSSMNEANEDFFGGRGELDSFLKGEQVIVRFPARYPRDEEELIDQAMGGMASEKIEELLLSPEAKKRLEAVARVGHWPPVIAEADPNRIRQLLQALQQGGINGMAKFLGQALKQEEAIGLSEEKIEAICREIAAKNLIKPGLIPLVAQLLTAFLAWERVWQVRKDYAEKIEKVRQYVMLHTAHSQIPVKEVIVGVQSFFRPADGFLSLSYEHVGQLSFEKLLGIARHEIGHVLFTRGEVMKGLINSPELTDEQKNFLKRVWPQKEERKPGDESFWRFFIEEREDVWVNYNISNEEIEEDRCFWECAWYSYYFKSRKIFGLDEKEARNAKAARKKKKIGLNKEEEVILRDDDLISAIEVPKKEELLQAYLNMATSQPQSVFSEALFTYAMTGAYSPLFAELEKSKDPLHQEIVQKVKESQPEYDLFSTGQNNDGKTDPQIFPDRKQFDPAMYPNTEKYKEAVENETRRAVEYTVKKFLTSPTLLKNFMALFEKRNKEERPQSKSDPLAPDLQDLLDPLSEGAEAPAGGEGEPGDEGEAKEPGKGEPGEQKPAEGITETMKDFKPSPKDGDLEEAIDKIQKEKETTEAKAKGEPLPKPASSTSESSEEKSEREELAKAAQDANIKIDKNKVYSEQVKDFIGKVSRTARNHARKLRQILLAQAQKEYEIYSRGGGRFSLQRYLEWKSKFMVKTVEEITIETIDVEILIDMSGSLSDFKEALANLALLMAAELGDLNDVGINFQIRGFDNTEVSIIFKPFQISTGKLKKIKPEQLMKMFDSMIEEIGNKGGQNFTNALTQSQKHFKERKAKHKLIFFVSDGQDYVRKDNALGRYVHNDPLFQKRVDALEKEKVTVVGIGVGDQCEPINIFDRFIRLGKKSELISEVILKVMKDKVTTYRNKPLPKGDLAQRDRGLNKSLLKLKATPTGQALLALNELGFVDLNQHDVVPLSLNAPLQEPSALLEIAL